VGVGGRGQVDSQYCHWKDVLSERCRVHAQVTQISEVGRAAQLDDVVVQNITAKLEGVLLSKNQQLKMLKFDVTRVKKAHDELIRVYEARLLELGIPESERSVLQPRTELTAAPAGFM
jgi:hypothetical protein